MRAQPLMTVNIKHLTVIDVYATSRRQLNDKGYNIQIQIQMFTTHNQVIKELSLK